MYLCHTGCYNVITLQNCSSACVYIVLWLCHTEWFAWSVKGDHWRCIGSWSSSQQTRSLSINFCEIMLHFMVTINILLLLSLCCSRVFTRNTAAVTLWLVVYSCLSVSYHVLMLLIFIFVLLFHTYSKVPGVSWSRISKGWILLPLPKWTILMRINWHYDLVCFY